MRTQCRPTILAMFGLILLALGLLSARPQATTASHIGTVSAGGQHTCLLTTLGGVKCWGRNHFGQLGDGTTTDSAAPVDVVGLESGVVAIAAGAVHNCAVTEAGGVVCWGSDGFGEAGDGTFGGDNIQTTPVDVVGLASGVVSVTGGFKHSCALTDSGGVKCWGSNRNGELGATSTDMCLWACSLSVLNVVGLSSGVVSVKAGDFHTCAVLSGGTAKCWGQNTSGQLGDGTLIDRPSPVDVQGLGGAVSGIASAGLHTCAVTDAGSVLCWGDNAAGQLGDGSQTASTSPVAAVGLTGNVAAISAQNGAHTCALMIAGNAKCWGFNFFGKVGDGGNDFAVTVPTDVVFVGNDVAVISAGAIHTCALRTTGSVTCWGENTYDQLGDSDGDGCTDIVENGTDAMLGGQRDPFNRWDFFDVWTHPVGQPTVWVRDEVVNVPGDIMGVANRFGANDAAGSAEINRDTDPLSLPPDEGYHPAFDRGPRDGPNAWNRLPADGFINVPDDILGVASQFGHSCA